MGLFLNVCLLIMPWVIVPMRGLTDQMRLPQMGFLAIIYFGMICLFFRSGAIYIYRNKWVSLFAGWMFLSLFFSFFIPYCLDFANVGRAVNLANLDQMIFFFLGLFVSYIALSNFQKEDYENIAKTLCISSTLVSLWSILQFIGLDPFGKIAVYKCGNIVSACLDNPNVVGNYLSLCLPLFLIFDKSLFRAGFIFTFIGILVTRSHLSIGLSLFSIVLFFYLCYRKNKWSKIYLFLISIIGVIVSFKIDFLKIFLTYKDGAPGPLSGRWDAWVIAFQHLKDNPLFGQGLGCWRAWEVKIGHTYWFSVHNDWLEKAIEIGLGGIILALLVVINSIRNFKFENKMSYAFFTMFSVFLIEMFFSFPLVTPTVGLLGLISWWYVEKF